MLIGLPIQLSLTSKPPEIRLSNRKILESNNFFYFFYKDVSPLNSIFTFRNLKKCNQRSEIFRATQLPTSIFAINRQSYKYYLIMLRFLTKLPGKVDSIDYSNKID